VLRPLVLAGVVSLALLTGLPTTVSAATPAPATRLAGSVAVSRTVTSYYSPVTPAGAKKPGYTVKARHGGGTCEPGSDTGLNVYRCFAGDFVYDPCWVETGSRADHVLCASAPWSHRVTQLTWKPSGNESLSSTTSTKALFGLRMADGKRCVAAQGAHSIFHGKTVNFYCNKNTSLLGLPNQHQTVWRMREAVEKSGKTTLGKRVAVAHGWYGRASISFTGA
jgi:hypothetical protein